MNKTLCVIAISMILPVNVSVAQESTPEETEADTPYEVMVTGRLTRSRLRNMIEEVEEDFFDRYNELNTDDTFDMYCYEYTPTMSHIKKRACEPLFMIKYRSQQSSDALFALTSGGGGGTHNSVGMKMMGVQLLSERQMRRDREKYFQTLIEKMEEFSQSDKQLAEIATIMEQLKFRLENYEATN